MGTKKSSTLESDASRHARTHSDGNNSYGPPNGKHRRNINSYESTNGKHYKLESDASRHARTHSDGNNSYGPPNGKQNSSNCYGLPNDDVATTEVDLLTLSTAVAPNYGYGPCKGEHSRINNDYDLLKVSTAIATPAVDLLKTAVASTAMDRLTVAQLQQRPTDIDLLMVSTAVASSAMDLLT